MNRKSFRSTEPGGQRQGILTGCIILKKNPGVLRKSNVRPKTHVHFQTQTGKILVMQVYKKNSHCELLFKGHFQSTDFKPKANVQGTSQQEAYDASICSHVAFLLNSLEDSEGEISRRGKGKILCHCMWGISWWWAGTSGLQPEGLLSLFQTDHNILVMTCEHVYTDPCICMKQSTDPQQRMRQEDRGGNKDKLCHGPDHPKWKYQPPLPWFLPAFSVNKPEFGWHRAL